MNQDCFHKNVGSSETLRETTPITEGEQHDFTDYKGPRQKKNVPRQFLEWFIGFSEGDGSFITTTNNRALFMINQKDVRVLYKIRQGLGFGTVSKYHTHFRYIVADRDGVERLLAIFNGNLLLKKSNARFVQWLNRRNQWFPPGQHRAYKGPCSVHPCLSSWCSGFIDAEGCFYAQRISDSRYSLGYRVRIRFTLDQRGERETLERIRDAFSGGSVYRRSPGAEQPPGEMWRMESWSLHSHSLVERYLRAHPLRSVKQIAAARFFRLMGHINRRKEEPWVGTRLARCLRLIESINSRDL